MTRNRFPLLSALVILLALAAAGCRGPHVAVVPPGGGKPVALVKVEVADTAAKREIGLMYRKHLAADTGMIFVFARARAVRFWMKNTQIPLDMIFADGKGTIIGIVAHAEPYSDRLLAVEGDSKYVLEVNAGFCKRFGVKKGDRLEFRGFRPRARN